MTQRAASRVVWSEHLLFLSSVTVFRVEVFSEVAISTVSRKTGNTACVCKISGVWIGRSAHRGSLWLHEKVEEAGFGEVHVPGAACAPW